MNSASLATAVRRGDGRAIARAITLVESARVDHRDRADALLEELLRDARDDRSLRIGITGVPGVGKSTFIEALGMMLVDNGRRVAVLSVDPSSALSGGSILGDKTRMERLARSPNAYIRPSPSAGTLGGVARRTRESIVILEAAGFDVVVVETVGVGQSETLVASMTDLFLLLLLPGGGDELQGIKRGIMELADIAVVNKADGDLRAAAGRAVAEYGNAMRLLPRRWRGWDVPVLSCSSIEGEGIDTAWSAIDSFVTRSRESGQFGARRNEQQVFWFREELNQGLVEYLRGDAVLHAAMQRAEADVLARRATAAGAARRIIESLMNSRSPSS